MSDLMYVILGGETKNIEFKEKYSKTMLKTVSAFANYHDGKIIIGVTDLGQVIGVNDPLHLRENIENTINDSVKPRPDYEVETRTVENKIILIFNVFKGDQTPYTIDKKAYRRLDTSSVEVEKYRYDELVLLGRNLTYEELPYSDSNLKFTNLEKLMSNKLGVTAIDEDILKSLELIKNNKYNNASALLADQNSYKEIGIDFVCYSDNSMKVIKDRISVSGVSIIEQYETGMLFYQKHINRGDIIEGAYRKSYEEIPKVAYREAIANMIIHRDYSRGGNNRVEIFEDRVEIVSIGGLPIGISEGEYIKGSFSNVRNRIIADLFLRCGIIEKMGTGIRRMKKAYSLYNEKPSFDVMDNSIKIVLPKIKMDEITNRKNKLAIHMSIEEEKALNFIKSTQGIRRNELEEYMMIKKTKATKLLNALLGYGVVIKIGTGKNTMYKVK